MGGLGSGRLGGVGGRLRDTLEESPRLDARLLRSWGFFGKHDRLHGSLTWSDRESCIGFAEVETSPPWDKIIVEYLHDRGEGPSHHRVHVRYTPCRFGGQRPWFECPECRRRCLVLVLHESRLACRLCLHIPYAVQSLGYRARILRRLHELEDSLPYGLRPKGMRTRTYERFRAEYTNLRWDLWSKHFQP